MLLGECFAVICPQRAQTRKMNSEFNAVSVMFESIGLYATA